MTQYNGMSGCNTCEEPGQRAEQGQGTSQYYPYRPPGERAKVRSTEDLNNSADNASSRHRINEVIGHFGLSAMPWLGIVPEYMHGSFLGVTRTLMYLWFSPTSTNKPYFIGNKLKKLRKVLKSMKRPDLIERLPHDLEKNYQHLKASEYQAWLLYYGVPCLKGFLLDIYLKHFAMLSEAIHLLLGNAISEGDLRRAELCDEFYKLFPILYSEGSCGLNFHNVGFHLVRYVRELRPLYSWSTFELEDINGQLMKMVHGTGDITLQLFHMKEIHNTVSSLDFRHLRAGSCSKYIKSMSDKLRPWKILATANNCCKVIGPSRSLTSQCPEEIKGMIFCATFLCSLEGVFSVR